MNSLQRVTAVLGRRLPDRTPVCLHNFLLAAAEAGVPMSRYRTDPEAVAEAHLEALAKYRHDCICIDLDTTMLAEALGAESACAGGEPGRIVRPAIESLAQAYDLKPVDPHRDARIPVLLESVRRLAERAGRRAAIRGNCDQGAFSLACLVRGVERFLLDLATHPDDPAITQLLDVCYESHLAVHRAVKEAGAHFTSLGDSLAGPDVLSPAWFRRYAWPYQLRLVKQLQSEGVFTVVHMCGDATPIVDQLAAHPFCGFELDFKTDAAAAKKTAGRDHVLLGNIDPSGVLACGTPSLVDRTARELISLWKPGGLFILNAGCAIPANTPAENVRALVSAAKKYGVYEPPG